MPSINITTSLSDEDRDAIINGVAEQIRDLLSARPEFVPPDRMSVIASLSPSTLDRLRVAGVIPSLKVGNRRLYNPRRVIEALEGMQEKGSTVTDQSLTCSSASDSRQNNDHPELNLSESIQKSEVPNDLA